jgi:hypothetical protein
VSTSTTRARTRPTKPAEEQRREHAAAIEAAGVRLAKARTGEDPAAYEAALQEWSRLTGRPVRLPDGRWWWHRR